MDTLQIDLETAAPGVVILGLSGSLDANGTSILTEACETQVSEGVKKLIFRLADVGFVSSSGIGTLLMLSEDLEEAGGKAVLCELSPEVDSVFKILDVGDVLVTAKSRDEALAIIQSADPNTHADEGLERSA